MFFNKTDENAISKFDVSNTLMHLPETLRELQHGHPECQLLESCQHHKPWQPKESLELLNLERSHRRCSFQPENA